MMEVSADSCTCRPLTSTRPLCRPEAPAAPLSTLRKVVFPAGRQGGGERVVPAACLPKNSY